MTVSWTESALADLQVIDAYIARNSPRYARSMIERIVARVEWEATYPGLGPVVREYSDETLREVFEAPYRIIYRIQEDSIGIVAVIHGARRLPSGL
ncbi:MAG: plasmid stabilization system [Planctomycetota bacterium]|nr:plasmid stabilization system [Planctomycetota bacterium]